MRFSPGLTGGCIATIALLAFSVGCAERSAPRRDPETEAAGKLRLAQALLRSGRSADAIRVMEEAVSASPRSASLRNFQGQVLFLSARNAEAEAAFRKALELDPHLTDAHNNLGALYDETGRKQEAESEYLRALADPAYRTPEKVQFNLGRLYGSEGRDEEAIRALRRAVEIDPKYYAAHFELASLLDRSGSLEEAVREYEVAAPEFAGNGAYHYRVGLAYFRLSAPAKAREHLSRVLEVAPGSENAARAAELLKVIR